MAGIKNETYLRMRINKRKMTYKVLDLFCGAGGLSHGFDSNPNFELVCAIDNCQIAIETYNTNFNHKAIVRDLTTFTPQELDNEFKIGDIDIIIGGPTCKGFSMAGRRQTNDPRNRLFEYYVSYLDYFKPKAFLMENVYGILSMKDKHGNKVLAEIMELFSKDYICDYYKLNAAQFEVPQNRRRVLFIGFRKDLGIQPTCPIIINNEPIPIKDILLPRESIGVSYYLSQKAIDGINKKKERMKKKGYGFGAQILKLDKPSYTIPARYYKDGYDALVQYEDNSLRRLTIEELKAIQTFPKDFLFCGSKKDIIIQIGNAVACRFAYHLSNHLFLKLNSIDEQ